MADLKKVCPPLSALYKMLFKGFANVHDFGPTSIN